MDSPVRILGAFVDTLYLNVYQTDASFRIIKKKLSDDLRLELDQWKAQAQDEEENVPTRFEFDGRPLLMMMKGAEGFNWIMKNQSINVCVNRSSKMNLCAQVRCSSEYLWKVRDLGKIVSDVYIFLSTVFGQYICLQPSAIDMAVDVLHFQLPSSDAIKEQFISRAQLTTEAPGRLDDDGFVDGPEKINRRWGRITGLPFGARAAALSAIIYDKTHEIKYKSPEKGWQIDYWAESARRQDIEYTEDMQVMRLEVRYRRPALREMKQVVKTIAEDGQVKEDLIFHGIDDAFMMESYLPGLWAYAVGHIDGGDDGLPDGWLRYVVPSETDVNRSRWEVHPDWQVIQTAYPGLDLSETEKEREEREKEELLAEVDTYLEENPLETSRKQKKRHSHHTVLAPPLVDPLQFNLAPYQRQRKRQVNMDRMVAQVTGCLMTLEAWRACTDDDLAPTTTSDFSNTLSVYYHLAEEYMKKRSKDYADVVQKKRLFYHITQPLA